MKKLVATAAGALIVLTIVVAAQPAEMTIVRTTTIAAPPDKVFAHLDDFHRWQDWSPWAKLDPAAKAVFEGAPSGKGAIFKWSGNAQIGEGSMTLTESEGPKRIHIKTDFVRPFESKSTTEFTLMPAGAGTEVTWSTNSAKNFVAKAVCLVMNPEKVLGPDMERGLAQLKSVAESAAQTPNSPGL